MIMNNGETKNENEIERVNKYYNLNGKAKHLLKNKEGSKNFGIIQNERENNG